MCPPDVYVAVAAFRLLIVLISLTRSYEIVISGTAQSGLPATICRRCLSTNLSYKLTAVEWNKLLKNTVENCHALARALPGCLHVCVCLFVTDNNIRQDSIYHNMHRATVRPPPPPFFVCHWLGFRSQSTHIHTNTHIQTRIKWLISEKARITSRQTWQKRQYPCPHDTPLCQPTQVNGPVASHEQPRNRPSQGTLGLLSTPLSHLEQRASSNNGCKSNYDIKICVNCEM